MSIHDTERLSPQDTHSVGSSDTGTPRRGVRWGPIWAGTIVTLPVFVVLQSLFFALGWLDLGFAAGNSGTATSIVSGILALVAFFVGGLVAASTAIWGDIDNGMLHGVLTWALAVVVMSGFALLGGGVILGSLGSLLAQITALQQFLAQGGNVGSTAALQVMRGTAGWTALALGLTAAAAAAGGAVGSRIRPHRTAPSTAA